MSTALYRRYRPDTFEQVIGQNHVTDPLRAALRANRVTHAYLFSGPRGCGKTTSARILARCLNCAQGPTDSPCGVCDSCVELATGGPGSLDVVEIDAASHGGVDDARDLRERASFAPVRDTYKIFIIDEAHMVSKSGFNALLKLVEEPPPHVKFVFATTEPEAVLGTIRSRTHHYPFRLVPPDILAPYLEQLCAEESIAIEGGVVPLVMRAGGGSVRDSLSVLDQLMAGAVDGAISYQTAVALLGYTDQALLDQTVDALVGGDGAAVYRVIERMVESGHDPRRFVEDFLQRLRDLLIISIAGDGAQHVLSTIPTDQLERMFIQAKNWGPRQLSRAADLTDMALRSMTGATSPRLQLELLIGRILVPAEVAASSGDAASVGYGAVPGHSAGGASNGGPGADVPGMVGMNAGGAPTAQQVAQSLPQVQGRTGQDSGPESGQGSGSFGARQAREYLAQQRGGVTGGSASTFAVGSGSSSVPSEVPIAAPSAPATTSVPDWESNTDPSSALSVNAGASDFESRASSASGFPEQTAPIAEPAPQTSATPGGAGVPRISGQEADVLRGRWTEVVENVRVQSRSLWSILNNAGQLGAVEASSVTMVFPTPGQVHSFLGGGRPAILAKSIYEVTGLQLEVRAEVGQAGGGREVTSAQAPVNRQPLAVSPSTSAISATTTEQSTPSAPVISTGWPEPTTPANAAMSTGWPEPTTPTPVEPEPATELAAEIENHGQDDHSRGDIAESQNWEVVEGAVEDNEPGEPEESPVFDDDKQAGERLGGQLRTIAADPYFDPDTYLPGDPDAKWEFYPPSGIPFTQLRGGMPEESVAEPQVEPSDQQATLKPEVSWSLPATDLDSAGWPTWKSNDLTSAESETQPQDEVEEIHISPEDDDSASIDDTNVENSGKYGVNAVLDVLGGAVIETRTL